MLTVFNLTFLLDHLHSSLALQISSTKIRGKSPEKKLDFIINLPYEALGKSLESFKGKLAIQMDKKRDHSLYDLECNSKIK